MNKQKKQDDYEHFEERRIPSTEELARNEKLKTMKRDLKKAHPEWLGQKIDFIARKEMASRY